MSVLYNFNEYNILIFMIALGIASGFQSYNVVSVYAMEFKQRGKNIRLILEGFVLAELMLEMFLLVEISYVRISEDNIIHDFSFVRYLFYIMFLGWQLFVYVETRRWQISLLWISSFVVLPLADIVLKDAYPFVLLISIIYLASRASTLAEYYNQRRQGEISGIAIKQAIDFLPSGILVVNSKGQIILMNDSMHNLLFDIMGKLPNDFYKIYWHLIRKTIHSKEDEMKLDGKILLNEKNNSYWFFERKDPKIKKEQYAVFVASDITEEWNMTLNLQEQTRLLERQSKELQLAVDDVEMECREQEIIALKGMFHDVLGQKIALLLRSLREHEEPEEEMLGIFSEGLPEMEDMIRTKYDAKKRLEILIKTFAGIGVTLEISGELPTVFDYAGVYVDILREAATNAVRHGYATNIKVSFIETKDEYSMRITNDGIVPTHEMVEGTGIKGMRKKVVFVGGYLLVDRIPEFAIMAIIPKKDEKGSESV